MGATQRRAVAILKDRGLQVGRLLSEPPTPTARIAFQAPEAGVLARAGDPVDIDFRPRLGRRRPPWPACATAAAAELAEEGVPSVTEYRLSADVPAGELIEQIPAAGAEVPEGGAVTLVVSAGNPLIAFDDGKDVLTMGATAGAPLAQAAASGDVETQPSWNADGSLLAYRRTTAGTANPLLPSSPARIWVASPADQMADPITDAGFDDRRPAFAPEGGVVAFVSNRPDGGRDFDLCFQRLDAADLTPSCVRSPNLSVSRPAWSPDGKAILVDSERLGGDRSELAMYVSRRAGSDRPADWSLRAAIPPAAHASRPGDQVRTVSWAPDGKLIAFSANWGGGVFRLFIASVARRPPHRQAGRGGQAARLRGVLEPGRAGPDRRLPAGSGHLRGPGADPARRPAGPRSPDRAVPRRRRQPRVVAGRRGPLSVQALPRVPPAGTARGGGVRLRGAAGRLARQRRRAGGPRRRPAAGGPRRHDRPRPAQRGAPGRPGGRPAPRTPGGAPGGRCGWWTPARAARPAWTGSRSPAGAGCARARGSASAASSCAWSAARTPRRPTGPSPAWRPSRCSGDAGPRLRTGWALKRLEAREGALRYVLADPDGGPGLRMGEREAALLDLLDGRRDPAALVAEAERRLGSDGMAALAVLLAGPGGRRPAGGGGGRRGPGGRPRRAGAWRRWHGRASWSGAARARRPRACTGRAAGC